MNKRPEPLPPSSYGTTHYDVPSDLSIAIWILSVIIASTGFLMGAMEAEGKFGTTGCQYQNIAAYFPTRALACELFRRRWP